MGWRGVPQMSEHYISRGLLVLVLSLAACNSNPAFERFEVMDQGAEVKDTVTGLVWQRCPVGMGSVWPSNPEQACRGNAEAFNWPQAQARAERVAIQSGKAWRLPTVLELQSLLVDPAHPAQGHQAVFPASLRMFRSDRPDSLLHPNFWSGNWYDNDPSRDAVWFVEFDSGQVSNKAASGQAFLRLVRSAQ
jgi:hypothetical protein